MHYIRNCLVISSELLLLACMQVPCASQLLREVPRSRHLVSNAADQLYRDPPQTSQLVHDADKRSYFEVSNMVHLPHPSAGVKFLKLKWKKFDHLASQVGGARNIFCELFGRHKAEDTFWLDSSSIEKVGLLPNDYFFIIYAFLNNVTDPIETRFSSVTVLLAIL